MSDLKPVASLNPKLLARKGGARPAMRAAMSALAVSQDVSHDDLGWNDMGHEHEPESVLAPIPVTMARPVAAAVHRPLHVHSQSRC